MIELTYHIRSEPPGNLQAKEVMPIARTTRNPRQTGKTAQYILCDCDPCRPSRDCPWGIVWLLIRGGDTKPPDTSPPKQTEPVEILTDTVDIPGYTEIIFKAGVTEQDDTILNPTQNFCWFKASLVLEDGTVLWTSDMIV